jgi:hypothetical protein
MSRTVMRIMSATLLSEIPWSVIAPHEKQALSNHGQTLNRLAERGGLAACEAIDIIEGRPWNSSKHCIENEHRLINIVRKWRAEQAQTAPAGRASQMNTPQTPQLPFAVFDEFGKGAEDRVRDHYCAALEAQKAEPDALRAVANGVISLAYAMGGMSDAQIGKELGWLNEKAYAALVNGARPQAQKAAAPVTDNQWCADCDRKQCAGPCSRKAAAPELVGLSQSDIAKVISRLRDQYRGAPTESEYTILARSFIAEFCRINNLPIS